jgi:hypothetical protein
MIGQRTLPTTLCCFLALPPVADRLRQSRSVKWGLAFLILGFLLQIIASWPR